MPDLDINPGELRSVHRPTTWRIWIMAMVSLGPLFLLGLSIVLLIDDFAQGRDASPGQLSTRFGCVGGIVLILALLIGFLISEMRKWYPTRTVRLKIYERGFTYEEQDRRQVCAWNEIKDITHRTIKVHSKHSPPRRISVIRSIVKRDGTAIVLAETLNLHKLTSLITHEISRCDSR
ncbi:MAG TPA: hypothetical protein VHQ95_03835 [Pyrinomonadaceae bacterium]|jgi:hypothetical protein|nr:hypothetical protein [Pyrinomonadaceae bacterium]